MARQSIAKEDSDQRTDLKSIILDHELSSRKLPHFPEPQVTPANKKKPFIDTDRLPLRLRETNAAASNLPVVALQKFQDPPVTTFIFPFS